MSDRETKKKKKAVAVGEGEGHSWVVKKALADIEEEVLEKEVEELKTWTCWIEAMEEQQLKEYVLNRPDDLQTVRTTKGAPCKRVQRVQKSKPFPSDGIMAAVWKFHKEEDESSNFQV